MTPVQRFCIVQSDLHQIRTDKALSKKDKDVMLDKCIAEMELIFREWQPNIRIMS